MKKHIALIGAGAWGNNHLRNLYELGVLQTVVERSPDRRKDLAHNYPGIRFGSDENDILKDPDVRGVVVAVPASQHFTVTKQLLLAGKDVLIEKPLALHVEEGEELVALARSSGRILMVGHILQYHPAVQTLKELVFGGELGRLRYIYSNRLNIGKLRAEENVLWSFAPHDISLILMLVGGREPAEVSAYGGAFLNPAIFDTTLTFFQFSDGVKGHIFVSWLHPFKEQKLVVVGSEKMAVFDDISQEKIFIYPHQIKIENGHVPVAQKADFYTVPFKGAEPLREELHHFITCVETREQPRTDGEEGLRVLKVLEKAEKSLQLQTRTGPLYDSG